jgi:Ca2+-binding EF-hand superfamily protein
VLQVAVSFGRQAKKWYDIEEKRVKAGRTWLQMLHKNKDALYQLFTQWDEAGNNDGMVSKKEFRHGVMALNVGATHEDINKLFDMCAAHVHARMRTRALLPRESTVSHGAS